MNFLILGSGADERDWAELISSDRDHRVVAAHPGLAGFERTPGARDIEEAFAVEGVDAAIVGGDSELRTEGLRRLAGIGVSAIVLHPPANNPDPYYQVSLSRQETGAVIVPDLAGRLHPGVRALQNALEHARSGETSKPVSILLEASYEHGDLLWYRFARLVDLVRLLTGKEIETVLASADPADGGAIEHLIVQLRGGTDLRGEIRLGRGADRPVHLSIVNSQNDMLTLEFDPEKVAEGRLTSRDRNGIESIVELYPDWDPKESLLEAFEAATSQSGSARASAKDDAEAGSDPTKPSAISRRGFGPSLLDGTRASELTDAVARSVEKNRMIELHYDEVSELGSFKAVMTSTGCGLLLLATAALPIALAGPALGFNGTLVIAYAIPPILVVFLLFQLLRFLARSPRNDADQSE
jgi:predicted dehydrogenase